MTNPEGVPYQLEFEVQPVGQPFTGIPQFQSGFAFGSSVTKDINSFSTFGGASFQFAESAYHWQVRSRTEPASGVICYSGWVSFGGNAETDADFVEDAIDPSLLKQYMINLGSGSSGPGALDTDADIILEGSMTNPEGVPYQLEFEVQPVGQPFTGIPQFQSGFAFGSSVTKDINSFSTFGGASFQFAEGAYHWQARSRTEPASGVVCYSGWVPFGGNAEAAADFIEDCAGPTTIQQALTSGGAAVPPGSVDPDGSLELRAVATDPEGVSFSIEVEVQAIGIPFTGVPTGVSSFQSSGSTATVSVSSLATDAYHWQIRVRTNPASGVEYVSDWIPFGANPETSPDFIVGGPPPDPTGLEQSDDSGSAAQPPIYADNDGTVHFRATVTTPSGTGTVSLQVEAQPVGTPFTGTPQATSAGVSSGSQATLSLTPGAIAAHRWRARSFANGATSNWVEFGGNPTADADFVIDLTAPVSAITTTGFRNAVSYPGMIQGTAADAGGGVALVQVSIRRAADLLWFDGAAFTSAAEVFLNGTGTTNWVYAFGATNGDTYNLRSRAVDAAGNVQAPPATASFTYDTTPPSSTPSTSGVVTAAAYSGSVAGTASDTLSGIASVGVSIRWVNTNTFWNGTSFVAAPVFVTATGTTSWSLPFAPADNQVYEITSRATDGAGNVESPGGLSTFTFDSTGPTSTVLTTGSFTTASFPGAITGTASTGAPASLTVVEITIRRASDLMYFDGAAFASATPVFLAATGTTSWSFAFTPALDTYLVESRATDDTPEVEASLGSSTFTVAAALPATVITTSGLFTTSTFPGAVQGTASGGTGGITLVEVSIARDSDGLWWDGTGFTSPTELFLAATGTSTWTLSVTAVSGQSYTVRARSTDGAAVVESPPVTAFFAISDTTGGGGGGSGTFILDERDRAKCSLAGGATAGWPLLVLLLAAVLIARRR
jgi:hypothetical protein